MDKASLPEDVTLYRGVRGEFGKILMSILDVGAVFVDRGFTSVTTDPQFAKKWSKQEGAVTLSIICKKGQKAAAINREDEGDSEEEIVIQAGSQYKVISYDRQANHAVCELVQE